MKTLHTLNSLDQRTALTVLARIAQSFLPHPWQEDLPVLGIQQDHVIAEIRGHLGIACDDYSEGSHYKIQERLVSEMSRRTLEALDIDDVRFRLGARGDLRADQYAINIPIDTLPLLGQIGVRPRHVEEAILRPDAVEHLLPEHFEEHVSLYLTRRAGDSPDSILTIAIRRGYTQYVRYVIRVFHQDVPVETLRAPHEVLRAFLDRYGLPLTIGQSESRKLFLYDVIPLRGRRPIELIDLIRIDGRPVDKGAKHTYDANVVQTVWAPMSGVAYYVEWRSNTTLNE